MTKLQARIEWKKAKEAADKFEAMLASEVAYLTHGDKLKNVYSPIAWVRLCRMLHTLTYGMACMRLVFEGKTNGMAAVVPQIFNERQQ